MGVHATQCRHAAPPILENIAYYYLVYRFRCMYPYVYWAFLPINQLGIAGSLQQRKVSQSGRSRLANGEPTNAQWTMLTSHNRHLLLASVLTATWHNVWHARKTILFIYLSIYFLYNNPHKTVEWRSKQCTWTSVS